jgi:hypothetical protein
LVVVAAVVVGTVVVPVSGAFADKGGDSSPPVASTAEDRTDPPLPSALRHVLADLPKSIADALEPALDVLIDVGYGDGGLFFKPGPR